MPVVSVKEKHERRRSSNRDGERTHTRVWLVVCDDIEDGTAVALTANDGVNSVPAEDAAHNKDGSARATSIGAEPLSGSGVHFDVTVEYSTGPGNSTVADPLDRPPEISYGYAEATEPYFLDHSTPDPKPVVNSAGDPFDQYLERERGEMVLSIQINEPTHNPVTADAFSHTTNQGIVTIDGTSYASGTLKLSPITAQKVVERVEVEGAAIDLTYYRRQYTLKARKDGWKDKPLDVGMNEFIADADPLKPGKLKGIVDAANLPVKRPWPLDGTGKRKLNPTAKPEQLEFQPYKEMAWTSLAFTWSQTWA